MKLKNVRNLILGLLLVNILIVNINLSIIDDNDENIESNFPSFSNKIDSPYLFFIDSVYSNINDLRTNYTFRIFQENHTNGQITYIFTIDGYLERTSQLVVDENMNFTTYSLTWIYRANIGLYYTSINTTDMQLNEPRYFHLNLTINCSSPLEIVQLKQYATFGVYTSRTYLFREITEDTHELQIQVPDINNINYNYTIMTDDTQILTQHHIVWPNITRNVAYGEWTSAKIWNTSVSDPYWDESSVDLYIGFVNWYEGFGVGYSLGAEYVKPVNETEIEQNWYLLADLENDPWNISYGPFIGWNLNSSIELVFEWKITFPSGRYTQLEYTFVQTPVSEENPVDECPECPECPSIKWNWGEYLSISLGGVIVISIGTIVTLNILKRRKKS